MPMRTLVSGFSLLRTLLLTITAIVIFSLLDAALSRTEKAESGAAAARAYENGARLMQQGRPLDATAQFDEAISLARENPAYPLALAEALQAAGRLPEAEAALSDLLETTAREVLPIWPWPAFRRKRASSWTRLRTTIVRSTAAGRAMLPAIASRRGLNWWSF